MVGAWGTRSDSRELDMGKVSQETLVKMEEYVTARNSPQRRKIVELVSHYVLTNLPEELDEEEALTLARYHLSTDRGVEDLKVLYPDALATLEELVSESDES